MPIVLIADRDADTRVILSTALQAKQITVIEADTAESAFQLASSNPVDVVVVNYPMRLQSGVTLTRALREDGRLCTLPILNVTSHVTVDTLADAEADGADHTVCKPIQVFAVVDLISAIVALRSVSNN